MSAATAVARAFKRLHLRGQLFLSCTLLMFLWLAIFALDSSHRVELMVGEQVYLSQEANLLQTSEQLTYHMQEMERLSDFILLSAAFQDQSPSFAAQSVPVAELLDELDHYFRQRELLKNVQLVYAAYDIRVYLDDGMLYAREGTSFFPQSELFGQDWYEDLPPARSSPVWVTLDTQLDSLCERRFTNVRMLAVNGMSEPMGVLTVSLPVATLQSMLVSSFRDLGGALYLLDREGRCMHSSDQAPAMPNGLAQALNGEMPAVVDTPDGARIARQKPLGDSGYQLLSLVPQEIVQQSARKMRTASLWTLLLMAALTMVLITILSQRLSHRIRELARSMTDMGAGAFHGGVTVYAEDEIGIIENKLNAMSKRLGQLVGEIQQSERRKREAELRALQAQINPHFLYNTLDTINWMAMEAGVENISSMAVSLGSFFRLSLSGGEDVITLAEEMEITRLYVEIQRMRMGDMMSVTFDVPEDLLHYKALKLLFQPLVENAVKHGFGDQSGQVGHIHIAVTLRGGMLVAHVENDGHALSEVKTAHRHAHSGYGIRNIRERLRLHFGEDSELMLHPGNNGEGAVAVIIWRATA